MIVLYLALNSFKKNPNALYLIQSAIKYIQLEKIK